MLPKKLQKKLSHRKEINSLRGLGGITSGLVDFSSNDYLGFSTLEKIAERTFKILREYELEGNGSSGSRLLSGNSQLYMDTEAFIANFHSAEAALIFNSGYDANIGFFSSVPQRSDVILYDEFIHASIRDGISLSKAKGFKFKHNDLEDLEKRLRQAKPSTSCHPEPVEGSFRQAEVYIVTESVFSMDGNIPDLVTLASFCFKHKYHLIVDEAHAVGVLEKGKGLVQELGIENQVFARIVTFGKALGCHGAVILGGEQLKTFLVNFARSFIYTTALSPHSVGAILASCEQLVKEQATEENLIKRLNRNIAMLRFYIKMYALEEHFIKSTSAIHSCVISGNERVKEISKRLKEKGFDVKSILSPTVPEGKERLRICIHSYNTEKEIDKLIKLLATFIQ